MENQTISLGEQIEVRRGTTPPLFCGEPMTISGLLLTMIPQEMVNHERCVRLGRIADEIDKVWDGELELAQSDYDLLYEVLTRGDRPQWVMENLRRAFKKE